MLLQAKFAIILDTSLWHLAIAAYLAAMALDEIDFRSLLGGIAERRFQRIAMSLGDGLVCADQNGLITVWNPGAVAIFGYQPEEMIGQPLDRICALGDGAAIGVPFSIAAVAARGAQAPGGKVMELEGRRKNGETFPLEACFSEWQGVEGLQYGAVMRDISARKREAERIQYLAEHDTLTGLANRNTLYEHLARGSPRRNAGAAQGRAADAGPRQVQADQRHARPRLRRPAALRRRRRGSSALVDGGESGRATERRRIRHRHQRRGRGRTGREHLAERISLAFGKMPRSSIGERQVRVNVSIGVALYPDHCETADELFGNADLALYRAKAAGRGRHVFFERGIRDELEARTVARGRTRRRPPSARSWSCSISRRSASRTASWPARRRLIRWRHPDARRGVAGGIHAAGQRVVDLGPHLALGHGDRLPAGPPWQQAGHDVRLGVNLSPSQLQSGDLAATVAAVLKDTGFSPRAARAGGDREHPAGG